MKSKEEKSTLKSMLVYNNRTLNNRLADVIRLVTKYVIECKNNFLVEPLSETVLVIERERNVRIKQMTSE